MCSGLGHLLVREVRRVFEYLESVGKAHFTIENKLIGTINDQVVKFVNAENFLEIENSRSRFVLHFLVV